MNKDFDMDEIFEHLVEQDNSAVRFFEPSLGGELTRFPGSYD